MLYLQEESCRRAGLEVHARKFYLSLFLSITVLRSISAIARVSETFDIDMVHSVSINRNMVLIVEDPCRSIELFHSHTLSTKCKDSGDYSVAFRNREDDSVLQNTPFL